MEQSILFSLFSFHRKCHIFLAGAIEARFDHILGVVVPSVEVHVSQTVVDAKVLDVEEMVICVEVPSVLVSGLLCVTKLVVKAKLEHQSVEGGRGEAIADSKAELKQEEAELLWHPVAIYVRVKRESSMEVVVQLVGMFIHFWEVRHPMLVVEEL